MMETTGDLGDSDSDRQLHHVMANVRPNRRRLSSSAMVKPAGTLTGDPPDNQVSDQGASENTLSASESGMEEGEGEEERRRGKEESGDPAHREKKVKRVGPEKRAHHIHRITKHKKKKKKKHFSHGRAERPSKRRRGQANFDFGKGEGERRRWSDSSDSDVEGGREKRDKDMKGVRRSRRNTKGSYLPYREHAKDESESLVPAKRQKKLRDSTANPMKRVPPARNFLGELLTDIPEVDMCSLGTELQPTTGRMSTLQPQASTLQPKVHTSTSPETSVKNQKATTTMSITPTTHSHSPQSHRPTLPLKRPSNLTSRGESKERQKVQELGRMGPEMTGKTSTQSSSKSCSHQDCVEKSPEASSKELILHPRKVDVRQKQEGKKRHGKSDTPLLSPVTELQNKGESRSKDQQCIDRLSAKKAATSKDHTQLSSQATSKDHTQLSSQATSKDHTQLSSQATSKDHTQLSSQATSKDHTQLSSQATSKDHTQLSSHYKLLSTWESDYSRGSNANRAPVLYAFDTIADKLAATKGPWLERAKLIWNHWKKIPPSQHEIYVARAKRNRMLRQGKITLIEEKHKIAPAISKQSSPQHKLIPSISKPQKSLVTTISSVQADQHTNIFSNAGTSVQCLVVSSATVLEETLHRDCLNVVTSPAASSNFPCQTSLSMETITIKPNTAITEPVSLKEIQSEDLCSTVDKEIETLEETLGSSPPAVPYSPRAISLSPCSLRSPLRSPLRSTAPHLLSPSRELEPRPLHQPSQPSPPSEWASPLGQRHVHKDSKTDTSRRLCLPNPNELSSFCASSALISPLCPISPTCTESSTPLASSVVTQEANAVSTTAAVFSLPLASLLPPNISEILKDLPSSDQMQLQNISSPATSEGSLALCQQTKSKKAVTKASVSPKQVRRRKKEICVPKGVSSAPGSIQKARKTIVPSSLTSNSAFLDTLIAKVCLPNQPKFKALQMPSDPETKAASSSSSSTRSVSPFSGVSIEPRQLTPVRSRLSSKSTSCVTSPSCSLSDQSAPSTPSPLHSMANPLTLPAAMTTNSAHLSTSAAFSTSTTIPAICQTGSNTSAIQPTPDMTAKTRPSGGDVSNTPASSSSLLHTSTITIPLGSTIAVPGIDQSALGHTCTVSIPSVTPTASTLVGTELEVNTKRQANAGNTASLVSSLPNFSLAEPMSTLAPTSMMETTTTNLFANGNSTVNVPLSAFMPTSAGASSPAIAASGIESSLLKCGALNLYTGNAVDSTPSLLEPSASAPAMSDPGSNVPTPRTQDMYTRSVDSWLVPQTLTTASPSPMPDFGSSPSLATCTGHTTSSYLQRALTTPSAMPSTLGMYTGANSSFLQQTMTSASSSASSKLAPSFLQCTSTSPSAMSDLGLYLSKPRIQDVVSGNAMPSILQSSFMSASTVSDLGLSLPMPGVLGLHTGNSSVTTSHPFQPTASPPTVTVPKPGGAQDMCTGNGTPNFLKLTWTTTPASIMSDLGSSRKPRALQVSCAGNAMPSYLHETSNIPKSGGEQDMSTVNVTPDFLQQTLTTTSASMTTSSYLNQTLTTASAPANMSDLGLGLSIPSIQGMYTRSADSSFLQQTMTNTSPFAMPNLGSGLPKPTAQNMNMLTSNATVSSPSLLCPTASTSASSDMKCTPGTLAGNTTPSFLQHIATSAPSLPDLGSNLPKPGALVIPSGKATIPSLSLFQSALPSVGLNAPKGLQDTHSGNVTPSLLPSLATASSSAATGHVKRKHPHTIISKAERLSKLGTTVNLPQGGTVPSFRIPVFNSDPFKPQTEHILPSLLVSSNSSRGQPKSFGSMAVSKLANPQRQSKTAEANSKKVEPLQSPASLSGQGFQSKVPISNFASANAALKQQQRRQKQQKQQQQQKQLQQQQQQQQQQQKEQQQPQQQQPQQQQHNQQHNQKQHQQEQQQQHRLHSSATPTFPNLESGNIPFPLNLPYTFPVVAPKTASQQQTGVIPSTSAELCDQSQSLFFQAASTSSISQDLGSNLRSHKETPSICSPTTTSPCPLPTSKHAVSGKEISDGTKHPFYVAPRSLLREFPEIGVVTTLHPAALNASTANAQNGKVHTGPYPTPHYDLKPQLHPELTNLPSFQSLDMPHAFLRRQTESPSIDNGGAIQYYPLGKHTSVTDTHTVNPANPTQTPLGDPQMDTRDHPSDTTNINQHGVGLSSLTPHSNLNSVLTTTTPVLVSPTTATPIVTASSTRAPTVSSSTDETPGHLKDSPSIVTASPSSPSVTSSSNNSEWRTELLRKLREQYMSEQKGDSNRWKQDGKAGMDVRCESRSDKRSSAEVATAKDKKYLPAKKLRKRHSKDSLGGLFTHKLPLSGDDKPLLEPRPMVAAPEQLCHEILFQSTPELASVQTPCSEDGEINPRQLANPPVGDLSRWELERLYLYNLALLEQQRRYTKMLEKRLIMMEQEQKKKKTSKFELYRQFLEFVVEPTRFPEVPAVSFPEISSEKIVLKGTFDKPILDEALDVYSSFSKNTS